jgi:hypothetical protein
MAYQTAFLRKLHVLTELAMRWIVYLLKYIDPSVTAIPLKSF